MGRGEERNFVNNYKKKCKFINPNPVVIIESLLNDLITVLNACKDRGPRMFHAASKKTCFKKIEKQAAALRVWRCGNGE